MFLNSDDYFDPDLPLITNKAFGGSMALWKKSLDSYATVHPPTSPSMLPLIFKYPGLSTSIHAAVYLPTAGQEAKFIDALANLSNTIENLVEQYPDSLIFVRGDSNVNLNNSQRTS